MSNHYIRKLKQKFPQPLTSDSDSTDLERYKTGTFNILTNFKSNEIRLFSDVVLNKLGGLYFEFLHFFKKIRVIVPSTI